MKYIYYHIYRFYLRWGDRTPHILSAAVISVVESLNILVLSRILSNHSSFSLEFQPYWILVVVLIYGFNIIYFRKIPKSVLRKWDKEPQTKKDTQGALIILYVIVSVYLAFRKSL